MMCWGSGPRWWMMIPFVLLGAGLTSESQVASSELIKALVTRERGQCDARQCTSNTTGPCRYATRTLRAACLPYENRTAGLCPKDSEPCRPEFTPPPTPWPLSDADEAQVWGQWCQLGFGVTALLMTALYGAVADRHGRKPVLFASVAGNLVVVAVCVGLEAGWAPRSWRTVLVAAYVAGGLGGGMTISLMAAFAYVVDVSPFDRRATPFVCLETAYGIGAFGCVLGAGFITERLGLSTTLRLLLAIGLVIVGQGSPLQMAFTAGTFPALIIACVPRYAAVIPESLSPTLRGSALSFRTANPLRAISAFRSLNRTRRSIGLSSRQNTPLGVVQ